MKLNALIMAGGEGKRFWPLSKKSNPKQFLSLVGEKSLIRQTVDRILPLIPIERIFVVTGDIYADLTLEHLPELPIENLILEPDGKNTAPCIAYSSLKINKINEDSLTVVLPADHVIGDDQEFRNALSFAANVADTKLDNGQYPLITLGVTPTAPQTGYGYIKTDIELLSSDNYSAYKVDKFTEKPDIETALSFLNQGGYYWNSGIFIWKNSSIISAFRDIIPAWQSSFDEISNNLGQLSEKDSVSKFYDTLTPGSIDKLILEHSENTLVIPINFPWSDVGSWSALDEYLRKEDSENVIRGRVVSIDSSNCLVYGTEKLIALVGVEGLVVVESEDSILVLNKEKSQDVKKVVEEINKKEK
ncbi:MAG: mannose-1-phosphate guanylyltransferase [Thermodesulfobacteriales bacterium]|nr:MAG: mannose-1-phosphate guanylyltransferase [Thermodesulfobacteriales bacterium]